MDSTRSPHRLRQLDDAYIWHPFAPMQSYREEKPPIISAGEGFTLIDTDGRRYIDAFSSLWCNVHGHRVERIDRAVRDQLDRVAHSTLLGHGQDRSIELAQKLIEKAPSNLAKVFYSDSGAASVEVAIKMAFQYHRQKNRPEPGRKYFVSIGQAYHGDTLGSVSVGAIELFHAVYGPLLFETLQVPSPVTYRVPEGYTPESYLRHCEEMLDQTLRSRANEIAAVVIEPLVQGAAGILVHPPGYLRRVRERTRELGILMIVDEVAVGFGRTGTLFACEQEGVEPDFLCLGKGITGGYLPLSATLTSQAVFDAFLGEPWENRTFFHGHTYTGNALACSAAIASLELFEENGVLANVAHLESAFREEMTRLFHHPHVGEIRQKGVMIGIELVKDRETSESFSPQERVGHRVTVEARKHGVLTRPLGDVVVLMPAPAMPTSLVGPIVEGIEKSIVAVTGR